MASPRRKKETYLKPHVPQPFNRKPITRKPEYPHNEKVPHSTLAKAWHHYSLLTPRIAILFGSCAQCDARFPLKIRGKQGPANCFTAIACTKLKKMDSWQGKMIDYILLTGNKLYHQSTMINKGCTCTTPREVFGTFIFADFQFVLGVDNNIRKGFLHETENNRNDLKQILRDFYIEKISEHCILEIAGKYLAIWRQPLHGLFAFDPNDRNATTAESCKSGTGVAVVMKFPTVPEMVEDFQKNYGSTTSNLGFTLTPIHIRKVKKLDLQPPDALPEREQKHHEVKPKSCIATGAAEKAPMTYMPPKVPLPLGTKLKQKSPIKKKKPVVELKEPVSNTPSLSSLIDPAKFAEKKTLVPIEKPKPPSVTYFHELLPKLSGILHASYHQNDPAYSKFYGKQTLTNALAAITMLRQHKAKLWFKKILDEILLTGETMYLASRQNLVGDQELDIYNIAKTLQLNKRTYEPKTEAITVMGKLQSEKFQVLDLLPALEEFFKRNDRGLIRGPLLLAVWSEDGKYYMFDPNERDQVGRAISSKRRAEEDIEEEVKGFACLTWFVSLTDLVALYMNNLKRQDRRDRFIISKVEVKDFIELPVDWFSFKALRHGKWILRGTLSQNNTQFSPESRNTQCTAMATMSIIYSKLRSVSEWTRDLVNEIILEGDAFYRQCVETLKSKNKFKNSMLLLAEIIPQYTLGENEIMLDVEDCLCYGLINAPDSFEFPNLRKGFANFFHDHDSGVLTARGLSVAIWRDNEAYFYFDSHSRGSNGYADAGGTACTLRLTTIDDLTRIISGNFMAGPEDIYNIGSVSVKLLPKLADGQVRADFKAYTELTPVKGIMRAGTHQGNLEQFDLYADKQTLPNMLVALGMATEYPAQLWDSHMLDRILDVGNTMYKESRREYIRKDLENKAAWELEEDPKDLDLINTENVLKEYFIGTTKFNIEFGEPIEGIFEAEYRQNVDNALSDILESHFSEEGENENTKKEVIIDSDLMSVAIWKDQGFYYLFDPRGKDAEGNFFGRELWSAKIIYQDEGEEGMMRAFRRESELGGGDNAQIQRPIETENIAELDEEHDGEEEEEEDEEILQAHDKMMKAFDERDAKAYTLLFTNINSLHDHIVENVPPNKRIQTFRLIPIKLNSRLDIAKPTSSEDKSLGNWYQFVELDRTRWILRGTLNMHNRMYPESNRGRQYSAICVTACVFGRLYALPSFKPITVDNILKYGDRLHSIVLKEKERNLRELELSDEEVLIILRSTTMRTEDVPKKYYLGLYLVFMGVNSRVVVGDLTVKEQDKEAEELAAIAAAAAAAEAEAAAAAAQKNVRGMRSRMARDEDAKKQQQEAQQQEAAQTAADEESILSLQQGVRQFFENFNYGVLNAKDISVAIWKLFDYYYMFDPESRGPSGAKEVNGTACITRYTDLNKLVEIFRQNLDQGGSNMFTIDELIIKSTEAKRPQPDVAKVIPVEPKITAFETITPGKMIIRGTFNHDHPKFRLLRPNATGATNALVALGMAHIHRAETWTKVIIDDVLMNGFKLHHVSVKNFGSGYNEWDERLVLNLVCPEFTIGVMKVNCTYNLDGIKRGILNIKDPYELNLRRACEEFFFEFNHGIIESEPLTTAIWFDKELYYMFDPNPRGAVGIRSDGGTACLMVFKDLKLLNDHFLANVPREQHRDTFAIIPVEVNITETDIVPRKLMKKADILKVKSPDRQLPSKETIKSPKKKPTVPKSPGKDGACSCPDKAKVIPEKPLDFPIHTQTLDDKKEWLRQQQTVKALQVFQSHERRLRKEFYQLDKRTGDAIVRAHYSQNHERFNALSRNKQTIPNALVAIVMARLHDPNTWSYRNIEIILDSGDALYQDSYIKYRPKDQLLGLRNTLRTFTLMHMNITVAVYKPCLHGPAQFEDLYRALLNFFMQETAGILLCDALSVAVFQKSGHYFMFIPHDCASNGFRCKSDGAACLLRYRSIENMIAMYLVNAGLSDESEDEPPHFYITAVTVQSIEKKCIGAKEKAKREDVK